MAGTKRAKIKKNDQVVVIAGRDKGKRGRVLEVAPLKGKIKIEGAGIIKPIVAAELSRKNPILIFRTCS